MLYWQGMEHELSPEQLEQVRQWLRHWQARLREVGLSSLLDLLAETPLGFLGAQALLILQPLLRGAGEGGLYQSVASLLSTAEGTAWLRQQLADLDEKDIGR
ncbi:MAG: hypothetical protein ACK4P1_09165 [Aggregatilineales bacterium]